MNKKTDWILFLLEIFFLFILILLVPKLSFGASVTDDNKGNEGYILINNGRGSGHQGTWVSVKEVPELKGDKGEKGDKGDTGQQGIQGIQGIAGLNGKDGKDVDPTTVINLQNTDNSIIASVNNEVSRATRAESLLQTNVNNEASVRASADTALQSNINKVDTNSIYRDNALQSNINSVNSRVNDVSNRISALEKTQYVVKTELKFIREKHLEVGVYGAYNVGRNTCSEVGLNIVIPVGEGYLDRENKKINTRLDNLEKKVGTSTVIERTVDDKGVVKSIRINQGQLSVDGKF